MKKHVVNIGDIITIEMGGTITSFMVNRVEYNHSSAAAIGNIVSDKVKGNDNENQNW